MLVAEEMDLATCARPRAGRMAERGGGAVRRGPGRGWGGAAGALGYIEDLTYDVGTERTRWAGRCGGAADDAAGQRWSGARYGLRFSTKSGVWRPRRRTEG